jgi:nucleoside-triphosphate--adenylate kinase
MRVAISPLLARGFLGSIPKRQLSFLCLIMGPPGGGKGTISKKIKKDFVFEHMSTGDILRNHVLKGTELGKEANSYMESGALVPDSLMVRLVLDELQNKKHDRLLLDGFPRTVMQAEELGKEVKVDVAINLVIPTDIIVSRLSSRWIHPASGRVYANDYNPPLKPGLDDETGEPLVQREDDKIDAVIARLDTYNKITTPVLEYYDQQKLLHNFAGKESDMIYPKIRTFLKETFSHL